MAVSLSDLQYDLQYQFALRPLARPAARQAVVQRCMPIRHTASSVWPGRARRVASRSASSSTQAATLTPVGRSFSRQHEIALLKALVSNLQCTRSVEEKASSLCCVTNECGWATCGEAGRGPVRDRCPYRSDAKGGLISMQSLRN